MHGSRFNQPDVAVTSHAITGRSGRVTGGVNRFVDTARLLSELLMRRPEYCQRWQRRIQRGAATTSLSRAAVARVIAEYLWDTGERAETGDSLPRGSKDRVGRARAGEVVRHGRREQAQRPRRVRRQAQHFPGPRSLPGRSLGRLERCRPSA